MPSSSAGSFDISDVGTGCAYVELVLDDLGVFTFAAYAAYDSDVRIFTNLLCY